MHPSPRRIALALRLPLLFAILVLFSPMDANAAGKGANTHCLGGCPSFYIAPRLTFGKLSVTDPAGGAVADFVSDTALGMEMNFELIGGPAMSVFFFYALDKIAYVPPSGRTIAPTSSLLNTVRLMAYYKDIDGRFFFGLGGEYRQSYFLDRVNSTEFVFEKHFIPRGLIQALIRLWGGGKGGGPVAFLELEGGYRLGAQSTSISIDGGLDFGGQFFYYIPIDKVDLRVGLRGGLEQFPSTPRNQKNFVLTALVGLVFK